MKEIKVNIITGFLGSGKTTAILNLLQHKDSRENWAIIVNEFGKISIDNITLSESGKSGELYEINGGCICCSAKNYFHDHLNGIINSNKFDRILIEPTGLGGTDMVMEIILSHPELTLMPIVCMVDCKMLENKRIQLIPLFKNQLQSADILVLSKCDLLESKDSSATILKKLESDYPGKIEYTASGNGEINAEFLNYGNFAEKRQVWTPYLSDKKIVSKTYTFSSDIAFDTEKLMNYFANTSEIIRAKGILRNNKNWKIINYSLSSNNIKTCGELPQGTLTIFAESNQNHFLDSLETVILSTRFR